jgi:hypothetical protein
MPKVYTPVIRDEKSSTTYICDFCCFYIGMSTRSLPPTDHYTLEFEKYDQILGATIEKEEPHFHYMQTGSGGQTTNPKTNKSVPAPEPKRPKAGQLYLALLDQPKQIKQLIEIVDDDIEYLRQFALEIPAH